MACGRRVVPARYRMRSYPLAMFALESAPAPGL